MHRVALDEGVEAWCIVRHDEAKVALGDSRLSKDMHAALSSDGNVVSEGLPGPALARHMLAVDPPDHTRLRRLVANAFTNKRIGAIGAAAVTVLTELLLMVGAIRLRPQGVLDRATTQVLLRVVIASVAMAPVVLALGSTPLEVQVVAGALVYGLVSFALGTISLHDVRSWGHSLGRERQPPDVNSISSTVGAD